MSAAVPHPDLGPDSDELRESLEIFDEALHDLWTLRDLCVLEGGPGDPTSGLLPARCQTAMDVLQDVMNTTREVLKARERRTKTQENL